LVSEQAEAVILKGYRRPRCILKPTSDLSTMVTAIQPQLHPFLR
jgi:hypothetical protein